jgi:hypothetical protein
MPETPPTAAGQQYPGGFVIKPRPKSTPSVATPKEKKVNKQEKVTPNPPFTTKDGMTSPKFGSAGGGGAENEPGPEAD